MKTGQSFPGKVVNFPPVTSLVFRLFRQFLGAFPTYPKRLNEHDKSKLHTHTHSNTLTLTDSPKFSPLFLFYFFWSAHVCHTRAAARIGRYYLCKISSSLTFYLIFASLQKGFALSGLYLFSLSLLTFSTLLTTNRKTFRWLNFFAIVVDFFVHPVWSTLFLTCVA